MRKRNYILGFLFAILASLTLVFGTKTNLQSHAVGIVTITFDANGGECSTSSIQTNESGTLDNLPEASKAGYLFVGWIHNDTLVDNSTSFSENTTITALYYLKSYYYTISKSDSSYIVVGKTQNSEYDYTISNTFNTIEEAINAIKNDLSSTTKQTSIIFNNLSLEQDLLLDIQNLTISGTLDLNEYSLNYNIPTNNSKLELDNITLSADNSQNLLNITGSNNLSIKVSNNCTFNSSSNDENYVLFINNTSTSIVLEDKIIYQTKYFYNHDSGTSTTANNIDLSDQTNGKLSITVPYYEDGSVIVSSNLNHSNFEFIPLLNNYTCSIVSNGSYLQAEIKFNIKFDANGGTLNPALSQVETRLNIYTPLYYPTADELTKTHSTLNGFVGKITLNADLMDYFNTTYSEWYFDKQSLNTFITEGSEDITAYFSNTKPSSSTNCFTFYNYDNEFTDLNFLSVVLMLDLNITPEFVALWSDTVYKISFETNGGSPLDDISGTFNSPISIPTTSNPQTIKNGYTFSGWYTSEDFSAETLVNDNTLTNMPDTNPTLYAKWTANLLNLNIYPNNGQEKITKLVPFESSLSLIPELSENYFTKTGHSFVAWYTSQNFETETLITDLESLTMPNEELNIYAKWDINQYTITLNTNHPKDDTNYKTVTVNYGEDISNLQLENPTFEGFTFRGWLRENRTPYTNTYPYLPSTMPAENVNLYAYWEQLNYTISYYVNGSFWKSTSLHFEDEITSIETPIVSGYIFNGWYNESLTEAFTLSSMPSHNIKVYAKMLEKKTITIDTSTQSYELSKNQGFVINVKLNNFTIEYLVGNKWQSTTPTKTGDYDVRITRFEDAQYNKFEVLIENGLKLTPNIVDLGTYTLILYCVAGIEILTAIIILFLRKQRQTYLNFSVILPFGMVSTAGFINFITSLVLAVFGFVLMILQYTKLRKVNLEIDKVSTENKEYTPPDVSTNETISNNVEILLKQEGFFSSDEDDSNDDSEEPSNDLNQDNKNSNETDLDDKNDIQ